MPLLLVKQVKTWQTTVQDVSSLTDTVTVNTASTLELHLKIQFDGHGYLLLVEEVGGSYCLDCWHPSLAKAEATAQEQFGITPKDWELVTVA
jgi:hypothetical protein